MMNKPPNPIRFFAFLLDQINPTNNLPELKKIHAQTITNGIHSHHFIRNKLVSSYASCAQIPEANLLFSFTNRKPTFVFNSLLRAYASLHQFSLSLGIFRQMILSQTPIDRRTLPVVLKSCGGLTTLRLGKQVHGVSLVNGYGMDLANSNALVTMYSKCGDLDSAYKVFDKTPVKNEITWSAMMAGLGIHGKCEQVFDLFDRMTEYGMRPDAKTIVTLLSVCSHGGKVEKGKEYWQMMIDGQFRVSPKVEHYTCMVDMLGRAGQLEEAEKLMMKMDVEPDEALWRALLAACKIHGKVEVAERVLNKFDSGRNLL